MNQLLGLTLELQIILVAGYLAYKTSVVGRTNTDRTEDFLFKVLAFGLIARLFAYVAKWIMQQTGLATSVPDDIVFLINGIAVVLLAIGLAMFWRRFGSIAFSELMGLLNVYDDDHHPTTWDSISQARTVWDFVQIHLVRGDVLESSFPKVPDNVPLKKLTINADGIAIYVTKIYRHERAAEEFTAENGQGFSQITFVPRDQIRQVDICWKDKKLYLRGLPEVPPCEPDADPPA